MRSIAIILALAACASSAAPPVRNDPRKRERQWSVKRVPSFAQASIGCTGLPDGNAFPGYKGRCIVSVNSAGTAEVTQCYDASGAEVTTTQGTGASYECAWTPPGGGDCIRAQRDVTDTSAPFVPAATAQAWLGTTFWSGDHTVYAVAMPTALTSTAPVVIGHGVAVQDGFYLNPTSVQTKCGYSDGVAVQEATTTPITHSKWAVMSCSRSGSNYLVRANGTESSTAVTRTVLNPSTRNLYFGRYNDAGQPMRGPLAAVYFFNAAHSSADKERFEKQVQCAYGSTPSGLVAITDTVSGARFEVGPVEKENLAKQSEELSGSAWVSPITGVAVTLISTNVWDTGATGAGVMTGDELTDESAVNGEGSRQDVAVTTPGDYTISCYMQQGATGTTRTEARLQVQALGGGSGNQICSFTDLSATTARKTCSVTTTAGFTSMRLGVYVGDANGDTGSIRVGACQMNFAAAAADYVRTYADARPAGPFVFAHGDNARWATEDGLASYAAVTNSLLHRRLFSGGAWILTTMTAAATAGLDRVSTSATRLTATAANATALQSLTMAAASRTSSIYIKRVTGTGAVQITRDNGTTWTALDATNCFDMATGATGTAINASAHVRCRLTSSVLNPVIGLRLVTSGDAVDVDYAQDESGAVAMPICDNPTQTAAATCNADVHTVSTSGWPTTSGEVSLRYTANSGTASSTGDVLFDSRATGTTNGVVVWRNASNQLTAQVFDASAQSCTLVSAALTWTAAKDIEVRWTPTTCEAFADGVSVGSGAATGSPATHGASAYLGRNLVGSAWANGSVKLTCVSTPGGCP